MFQKAQQKLLFQCAVLCISGALLGASAKAAKPTSAQALRLEPIQKNVDYDVPEGAEVAKCTISAEKHNGLTSWVVRGANGEILRMFSDKNKDNVVDSWSYFKNGLEVYRDIDANYNGKADQYRWFQLGGTRWGLDKNEDGRIDTWKRISAEEVAAEVVAAMKTRDTQRFSLLLATPDEIQSLGLGDAQSGELAKKVKDAEASFSRLVAKQSKVNGNTTFVDFGGARPGVVPAGVAGSTKDLVVYENVDVLVETDGKHEQVQVGTLVQVGSLWRLIGLPVAENGITQATNSAGYFYRASITRRSPQSQVPEGPSQEVQKVMAQLEILDRQIENAASSDQEKLNEKRADLLEKLALTATDNATRQQWVQQLADTVSAAVQTGSYANGIERLETLEEKLAKGKNASLVAYVKFRRMSASYGQSLQQPDAKIATIQEKWLADLEQFVDDYSASADAAEAMLQLAIANEFAGEDKKSIQWYERILKEHATSKPAKKAHGAVTRLESVGKGMVLKGKNLQGQIVDLARYRGRTVLIQYWATWCEPCKADMNQIAALYKKYGRRGFSVIGVNLDNSKNDLAAFLKKNNVPWQQIYEPGGLESRLANEMGVMTLPTMILVDQSGRVVNRGIHATELEGELKKLK